MTADGQVEAGPPPAKPSGEDLVGQRVTWYPPIEPATMVYVMAELAAHGVRQELQRIPITGTVELCEWETESYLVRLDDIGTGSDLLTRMRMEDWARTGHLAGPPAPRELPPSENPWACPGCQQMLCRCWTEQP